MQDDGFEQPWELEHQAVRMAVRSRVATPQAHMLRCQFVGRSVRAASIVAENGRPFATAAPTARVTYCFLCSSLSMLCLVVYHVQADAVVIFLVLLLSGVIWIIGCRASAICSTAMAALRILWQMLMIGTGTTANTRRASEFQEHMVRVRRLPRSQQPACKRRLLSGC